ncbi:MAG: PAS domain S-box protein, partial [Acidaminobacteraceae bacterium]
MNYEKLNYEMINILENYDDPVVIINGDKIKSFNQHAKKFFKIENQDEYIGKNISILKSQNEEYESYFAVLNESEEKILNGDKTIRFKFKHMDSLGCDIDTEVVMVKIYDGYDKYLYGVLIYDLSDFKLDKEIFDSNAKTLTSIIDKDAIVLIIDSKSRNIIDCSKKACEFYGYSLEFMKSLNIRYLNTLSNREIKMEVEKASNEKRNHFIFRHRISNGKIKFVRVISGSIRYDDKDCLYSVIVPFKEEEKISEANLFDQGDIYGFVFENLPFAAIIMDVNFNIIKTNSCFSTIFKYKESDVIGQSVMDNIAPSEFAEETHVFQSIINSGNIVEKEVFRKNKDGEIKAYNLRAYPIRKLGEIVASVVIYDENTEVRKLRHKVNLIEKVNENLYEGMIITDHIGDIKWLNKSYSKITGYSLSELVNKNPRILKSGIQDSTFYKNMWNDIEKCGSWSGEMINIKKDGTEYIQWERIIKVINEYDRTVNYIAVVSDITGFKAQEEKIKLLAYRDNLTDLHNRGFFMENADSIIKDSLAIQSLCAVLYIDLDKFKSIND